MCTCTLDQEFKKNVTYFSFIFFNNKHQYVTKCTCTTACLIFEEINNYVPMF